MAEEENKILKKIKDRLEYFTRDDRFEERNLFEKECLFEIGYLTQIIEKLQKENEELKNKVAKRNNELIELEETSEKEFLTKQEVKENYIPKGKIREIIEKLENEEKALRKDFEKHRVQLFELYKKVVLIEGYKKLLEEE